VLALEKGFLRELVRAVDLVELDDRQHGPDVVLCKVRRAGNGNWEVAQEESVPGLRVLEAIQQLGWVGGKQQRIIISQGIRKRLLGGGTAQLGLDFGEGVRMGDLFAKQAFFARIEIAAGGAVVAHLTLGINQNLATVAAKLDHW
jgi:hypothetical protein